MADHHHGGSHHHGHHQQHQRVAGTNHWDKFAKGVPTDLSAEQREILDDFLRRVPKDQLELMHFPEEPDEYFGCRVLRARKFDIAEALKLVADTAKWRTEKRISELAARPAYDVLGCLEDELAAYYPKAYFPLPDRDGRPVYVERTGVIDVDSMFLLTDLDRLVDYHVWCTETGTRERTTAASKALGRPVHTIVSVLDLDGLTMKQAGAATRSYIARASALDSAYYPETLGKMLVINAPGFFTAVWALIKVMLDERTLRKVEILGGPAAWRPKLAELCGGPERVPVEYGGTLVVPGGLFPVSRTRVTVLASGKTTRAAVPAAAGATVQFKWYARHGDVRWGVTFHAGPAPQAPPGAAADWAPPQPPGGAEVVRPAQHPHCDTAFVVSAHVAPADGYFLQTWDNNKAWAGRSREIFHRWDILVNGKPVERP